MTLAHREKASGLRLVDHQIVGDSHATSISLARSSPELSNATGDVLELAGAAAVFDRARAVEALAVPGAGRRVGKAAARALDIAFDVKDAPVTLFTTIEGFDDIDRAAVQLTATEGDAVGNGLAASRLGSRLLTDVIVEGDLGLHCLCPGGRDKP